MLKAVARQGHALNMQVIRGFSTHCNVIPPRQYMKLATRSNAGDFLSAGASSSLRLSSILRSPNPCLPDYPPAVVPLPACYRTPACPSIVEPRLSDSPAGS
ncbi:unnamed protein product [Arctogadus glacialis]